MSNLRKHKKTNYTTIDNDVLSDQGLSFRARGIAAYLLSKPDDWTIRLEHLVQAGTEGKAAIRTALHELATLGYLKRERTRFKDGTLTTTTHLADYPAFADCGTPQERITGYAQTDLPETGMSETDTSDNGTPVDQPSDSCEVIVSTDLPITDLPITEDKESASAGADGPTPDPDSPAENYDAVFGPGTMDFDPPAMPEPKRPIEEEWNKPLSEMEPPRAMFAAVLDAIGWDRKTLTERDRGQVAQACRKMREAGYEYWDVGEFMRRIWFQDWRWTDKASRPTLNQLRQEIGKLRAGVPENIPRRQSQGADAVDSFFDRLERQGVEIYQ